MRALLQNTLDSQRDMFFAWVPICLAIGIGLYFWQYRETQTLVVVAGSALATAAVLSLGALPLWLRPIIVAVALVIAGFAVAKWQAVHLAAPQLTFRYYGPIEGRVVGIDRSGSDALRLTLDRVRLSRLAPERTPARVRVSLHGDQPLSAFAPGDQLILTGHLSPPSGPAEPGGFDFQRHAWFLQIGAVGYTRTPVLRAAVADRLTVPMRIFHWRMALSHALQRDLPGSTGGFAAAIMTGDRSGIAQETFADLRAANLAHLLAISGLHMGLLTGFVFALVRYGLALVPYLALRLPVKKLAALCALLAGAFYLALSGGNVATERAFVMAAVMLVAVLLDRRALTLRAVAIAAVIVLLWQPHALLGPGFQMSFAATTALVAVFGWLRRYDLSAWPRWLRGGLTVVLSSFIAGLATAPFAAVHFNMIPHFGLIANVLSVPLMGAVIMPAGVLALLLAPFDLWAPALWVMGQGLGWILNVAQTVSGWEGAVSHIKAPDRLVLPLLGAGLVGLVALSGRLRLVAVALVALACLHWAQTERPDILIADTGGIVGQLTPQGRALSRPRGDGFVAQIWLENDGAPVTQEAAALRAGFLTEGQRLVAEIGPFEILQVRGKTALRGLEGCDGADLLISNQPEIDERNCPYFDQRKLRQSGALALSLTTDGQLRITTARQISGRRLWNEAYGQPLEGFTLSPQ
ncbi:ComEC/Rec2 family competence protein [Yoonia litorea]|uniref:Competence protein ComEC n=1 Tax=Yoonia litorea TaxID=1123755 RepID=A0A1I6MAD3_9RHOB|nr:ComEC/Rec2 family competence protein [Yoonia litorea]SFS12680.1 competence protein ComEC [Yoonia litorea]